MVAVGRVSSNGFLQNKNSKYIIEHLSLKYLSQKNVGEDRFLVI